jgi:cellulose synthase/poly-beta-1,6-N-acetylglucosamine synthase-like glycosyltransferase
VKLLFWTSVAVIGYAYVIYPIWLFTRARLRPRPVRREPIVPSVSVIMAVRNEAKQLPYKLLNLQQLDYPADRLDVVIISDGSTDETNEILRRAKSPRLRAILLPEHQGKAEAINRGLEAAGGEIIVFTDARQRLAADSFKKLLENFADPSVGCVSGELVLDGGKESKSPRGVGSYWEMEKAIRYWEGLANSAVGATGALYAVRRRLVPRVPVGTILDDVFIPMEVARRGARVIFEPQALAWDKLASNPGQEFHRKVRTLAGNYQLLRLAPWLLTRENPLRFEFVSHKLFRLAVPFGLLGMLLSAIFLLGPIYRLTLVAAICLVALGALAFVRAPLGAISRLTELALAFLLLNTAAIVAFFYFVFGKKQVWVQ